MQTTTQPTSTLAILIDADNARPAIIQGLMDEVAKLGRATVRRIYGDWTTPRLGTWKSLLLDHSIQPVQQFAYTSGKNATDSALIIDAMDLLYAGNLDGFCLVSSDSDFTRLASRLKESGKRVYGFGEQKTPKPFVAACDRFIYTEVLLGAAGGAPLPRKSAAEMDRDSEFVALVGDAIDDSADDTGWANLSAVGTIIRNKKPDFDSRNYGYKKLWELLDASSHFESKLINNIAMVRREKK